jgi:phosphatidylinositol glycan class Z
MTLCSLAVDVALLWLARMCDLDPGSVLITFASSHVAVVYLTRTFSNSVETLLVALLLYLVIRSIKAQFVLNDKFLIDSGNRSSNGTASVISAADNEFKINKRPESPEGSAATSSLSASIKRIRLFDIYRFDYKGGVIGLVMAVGVFNRPTFLIFAFVPLVYWLLYGLEKCHTWSQIVVYAVKRLLAVAKVFVPVAAFFVLFDTVYFYKYVGIFFCVDFFPNQTGKKTDRNHLK